MLAQLHTKCIFHDLFVSSISYRPTDLSLLKEFSKNISFSSRPEDLDVHVLALAKRNDRNAHVCNLQTFLA